MKLIIDENYAGIRLDKALSALSGLTRAKVQQLMDRGAVSLNSAPPQKGGVLLKIGDVIEYEVPEPEPIEAVAQDIDIDIVYEDKDIAVINKPRGLVVHPAAGHRDGTLVNALLYHLDELSDQGSMRPGIVHRLDKETTGLMVVAKNDTAHAALSSALKDRDVNRLYIAAVFGGFKEDFFTVEQPIGRSRNDRKKMAIVEDGRYAKTDAYVLEQLKGSTLLKLKLHTGRTHQIRVHVKSLGHPVLGDDIYSTPKQSLGANVLMLHAFSLSFDHPISGEKLSFTAPPPDDFINNLKRLSWSGSEYWNIRKGEV